MTDIIIQGIQGRMGRVLQDLIAQRADCRVVAGVDLKAEPDGPVPVFADFAQVDVKADVLIDFSAPEATREAVAYCAQQALPCVICTTGLTPDIQQEIYALAKKVPVFQSANMSLGVNLLVELCKKASQILGAGYDVEIVEKHHHNKVDAPSGTALMLADAINDVNGNRYHYVYDRQSVRAARSPDEIGISAVRGGSITGEHDVLFCGPDEVIALRHTAYSRNVFANGAVNAAVYIAKKAPGLYNMSDMIADT